MFEKKSVNFQFTESVGYLQKVPNKLDHEQMEQHLYDKPRRDDFYAKLVYGRCLHRVLSSEKAYDVFSDDQLDIFKRD